MPAGWPVEAQLAPGLQRAQSRPHGNVINMGSQLGPSKNQQSLLGWLSAFARCRLQLTASACQEPGERVHVGRAFGSRQTWRLRRSALIRYCTTRLNVITTGGWRFLRVLAAGKAAATFKRSEVEPLLASEFQVSKKNKRDILIIGFERAKEDRERQRAKERDRVKRLLSSLQVYFRLFVYGTMNSSAGAGNFRRGSAKGDKVTAQAFLTLLLKTHIRCVHFPLARKKGS